MAGPTGAVNWPFGLILPVPEETLYVYGGTPPVAIWALVVPESTVVTA
jgi:hypothetical protein